MFAHCGIVYDTFALVNPNLKGGDLHSQTAETHISGVDSATVWVDRELDASISGAGSVNYYGDPSVQEQIIPITVENCAFLPCGKRNFQPRAL